MCRRQMVVCPGYARSEKCQSEKPPTAVLDGKYIMAMASLASHQEAQLPHALSALPGRRPLGLRLLLPCAAAILLVKLLPSPQPLLLEALNDVDGAADVGLLGRSPRSGSAGLEVREHARCPGQRLGLRQARPERQGLEGDAVAFVHR